VRVGILARTLADPATGKPKETDTDDTGVYDVDGDGVNELFNGLENPGDTYKRRVFQAVVHLRNL
jgi:hypothetical protein